MSTNAEELTIKEFAQGCINALANIKRSMPKNWEQTLQPYKIQILDHASKNQVSKASAIIAILRITNKKNQKPEVIKMESMFYMAAYCDLP
ncbi:MAG: hypothetical protein ACHQFW_01455 [Chitinophagales bacterium]